MKVYSIIKSIGLNNKPCYFPISYSISVIFKIHWTKSYPIISLKNIINFLLDDEIYFSKKKAYKKAHELNGHEIF